MRDLVEYLPPHLAADTEVRAIMDALTVLLRRFLDAIDDVYLQFQPQTATWGLEMWETAFGLRTAAGAQEDQRRAALVARIRSARTATVPAVRALVAAYTDGAVNILEYPAEYRIEVYIESFNASPQWAEDIEAALADFLPAHLACDVRMLVRESTAAYAHAAALGWSLRVTATALNN